jgi:two-component system, NarL family, sensor kinase
MLSSNSENPTTVGLESILSTAQLSGRRTRAPNHVAENDALIALSEVGFASAADWFVDEFAKRSGIEVKLDLSDGMKRRPQSTEIALFRILQESLTNVHRPSGSSVVEVRREAGERDCVFTVRDFGHGMHAALMQGPQINENHFGVGLRRMRERVNDLDGNFGIQSGAEGTEITVSIPLRSDDRTCAPEELAS